MKLTSLLLFPLLLLLLAFQANGRTVSRCELRDKLREKITLSERTQNLTDIALTLIVCQLEKISQLKTSTVHILGQRDTTTTPPTTTTTTTTIPTINTTSRAPTNQTNLSNQTLNSDPTVPPALTNTTTTNTTTASTTPANQTNFSNQTLNSDPALPPGLTNASSDLNQTLSGVNNTSSDGGQDQDQDQDQEEEPLGEDDEEEEEPLAEDEEQEEELLAEGEEPFSEVIGDTYDEEGEYLYVDPESTVDFHMEDWRRLMELLNEEENEFDEEQLRIADDKLSGDNGGFGSGSEMFQVNWSLGYHGIFQLTDSYFCQSSARWSQNVCNSTCGAFSDDDITDDLDCFVDSLYWLYVLRTVGYQCYETTDFFGQCN